MRSLSVFKFSLVLSFFLLMPLVRAHAAPLEVGGWIPYWREASGTQDVLPHLSSLTEISPFVYVVQNDGTIHDAGNMSDSAWQTLIAQARQDKTRLVPTVMWSNGAAIQNILSNTKSRIALEEAIANLAKENAYDGIDIDFENKLAETKNYFSTFLKGLYARMGQKWVYCSIEPRMPLVNRYGYGTTPPADATDYANDYVQINKYCDRVELMTYDQSTADALLNAARAAPYVPIADPAWVEEIVNLAAQTISKKKILIGIPTYGYEYSVTPSGSGYQYDLQWAFDPRYALNLAAEVGASPVRNSADELSFIYKSTTALVDGADTTTPASTTNNIAPPSAMYSQQAIAGSIQPPFNVVWWSDAKAISDKITLAQKLGVRGVAIFKLDGGEDQNIWNVLPNGGSAGAQISARSLYLGLSGSDVKLLQSLLITKGLLPSGKNTGYFGPLTQAAVRSFQCTQGIVCSGSEANGYGVVGPATRNALQ